jgi:predicted short-subunit dehydrogenase-like oxidoreductase (DUF2520 family)
LTSLPQAPLRIALIGSGRVGTAVASLLASAGHKIAGVASRSEATVDRAAEFLQAPKFSTEHPVDADVYLIGTPADVVLQSAELLASRIDLGGRVVVHFAGVSGIGPLEPARFKGAATCALHPVQACPDFEFAIRNLPGSTWGVTCSEGSLEWVQRLIEHDLQGRTRVVAEADRPAWHAAAVMTSNGLAALLASSELLLGAIEVDEPEKVLGPLARGTLTNASAGGGGAATLTGPVVRGEVETVRAHIEGLGQLSEEHVAAYMSITRMILDAARKAGRVDRAIYESMVEELER